MLSLLLLVARCSRTSHSLIMEPIVLGTAIEQRGSISRGRVELLQLPTGDTVSCAVVIVSGTLDGPTFLVTASTSFIRVARSSTITNSVSLSCVLVSLSVIYKDIHGDEVTGVVVVHRVIERLSAQLEQVRGRVVFIPSLNPTGLLAGTRFPQFDAHDPNRAWPNSKPSGVGLSESERATDDHWDALQRRIDERQLPQETAFAALFALLAAIKPSAHIDLHTFSTLSLPFIFMDRVLYDTDEHRAEAIELFERTQQMVTAMQLTVLLERPAVCRHSHRMIDRARERARSLNHMPLNRVLIRAVYQHVYIKQKLHRSTSGATLNKLRIPSCTIELGPMDVVSPSCRDAGIQAVWNALSWLGNLAPHEQQPITACRTIRFTEPHRYMVYPQATCTGIVDFLLEVGSEFQRGDRLAVIRSIDGTVLEYVVAEMDGWLIAWSNETAVYKNQTLGMVAVADHKAPGVLKWSELPPITFAT